MIKEILYILFFPFIFLWHCIKYGCIFIYYIVILMFDIAKAVVYFFIWIFEIINNIFNKNKIHFQFPETSKKEKTKNKNIKSNNYKDEEFESEAKLWGLSEEDKQIAKKERMSPADYIEAEERDDDELITDEWEDNKC